MQHIFYNNSGLLPPPLCCDNCNSLNITFTLKDGPGDWPYVWLCIDCGACVGCHNRTSNPLGFMAKPDTRRLRAKAHGCFDIIWKSGLLTRNSAYNWLASKLKIDECDCHISQLSNSQLGDVIKFSTVYYEDNKQYAQRRKAKNETNKRKRFKRIKRHIDNRKKHY